jgi:hypothetical protein
LRSSLERLRKALSQACLGLSLDMTRRAGFSGSRPSRTTCESMPSRSKTERFSGKSGTWDSPTASRDSDRSSSESGCSLWMAETALRTEMGTLVDPRPSVQIESVLEPSARPDASPELFQVKHDPFVEDSPTSSNLSPASDDSVEDFGHE